MNFLVDLDKPHYMTLELLHSLPLVLIHYLLVINLLLPLLWEVIEVVMTKGVVVEDVAFISALIVMVRIIR